MKESHLETLHGRPQDIQDDLSIQSVVDAWHRVGGRTPTSVELLKRKRGWSAVYRLSNGSANVQVIAKGTGLVRAVAEAAIYQDVLAGVPAAGLEFLGYSVAESGAKAFVFLEDAGDLLPDGGNSEHSQVVGQWLATLHTSTAQRSRPEGVPAHDVATYEAYCRLGSDYLDKALQNKALGSRHQAVLGEAISLFRQVAHHLSLIDYYAAQLPLVLVHGDLVPKNMRIRNARDVLVFDWEMSGWGSPVTDLATLRSHYGPAGWNAYQDRMLDEWVDIGVEALNNAALGGLVLRQMTALYWASTGLSKHRDGADFEYYVRSTTDYYHARIVPKLATALSDLSLRE